MPAQHVFNSNNLIRALSTFMLIAIVSSVHVEINNLNNGNKMILEGKAGRINNNLLLNPVQIIDNTLTQIEELSLIKFYGHKIEIDMNQLARAYQLQKKFTPVITAYWIRKRQIQITFTFSEKNNVHDEDFEKLYKFMKQITRHPTQQDF